MGPNVGLQPRPGTLIIQACSDPLHTIVNHFF
jgi:hypothetical protein